MASNYIYHTYKHDNGMDLLNELLSKHIQKKKITLAM